MRTASALILFVLSISAGYGAFDFFRHLKSAPPETDPTDQLITIGSVAFSPFTVVIALNIFAVLAGIGGIVVLVTGHDKSTTLTPK